MARMEPKSGEGAGALSLNFRGCGPMKFAAPA